MDAYVLEEMTWPEVKDALEEVKVAILPVGSCEQHGPHIALSADIASSEAFATMLTKAIHPAAILAPPVKYGISPHHMAFPGTLSLGAETFISILMDIASSLSEHGVKRLFVVNGHGGNQSALSIASARMRRELGVHMFYSLWPILGDNPDPSLGAGLTTGHACVYETSLMLHLRPDLVRKSEIVEGTVNEPLYGDEWKIRGIEGFHPWEQVTQNGALHGPPAARADVGEGVTKDSLARAIDFLERFMTVPTD